MKNFINFVNENMKMKTDLPPFRMKINNQVDGIDVIANLSRRGIGLMKNFSFPFHLIMYYGENEVLTMTDEWVWSKHEFIPIISYEEFCEKYDC